MNEFKKIKVSDQDFSSWPKSLQDALVNKKDFSLELESMNKLCHQCDYLFFENGALHYHSAENGIMSFSFENLLNYHKKSQYAFTKEPLFKALGIKGSGEEKIIWDMTCGTGKDSILIYHFRGKVTSFERNPLVFLLLQDALRRFPLEMEIYFGEAKNYKDQLAAPDIIYFDPMYPEKKKSHALPRKEMIIFKDIVGEDEDSFDSFMWAYKFAKERVVVKRSLDAQAIKENPTASYKGKSTRYDMYKIF